MDDEGSGGRRRLLAALDNVRESYDLLRESFDAEVCADLMQWLEASQDELKQLMSLSQRLH